LIIIYIIIINIMFYQLTIVVYLLSLSCTSLCLTAAVCQCMACIKDSNWQCNILLHHPAVQRYSGQFNFWLRLSL